MFFGSPSGAIYLTHAAAIWEAFTSHKSFRSRSSASPLVFSKAVKIPALPKILPSAVFTTV